MKWFNRSMIALSLAAILTAASAVVSFIVVMFTSAGVGRHSAFFGSLFFESREAADGATEMGFGLQDPLPILVFFGIVLIAVLAVYLAHDRLVIYRTALIAERTSG